MMQFITPIPSVLGRGISASLDAVFFALTNVLEHRDDSRLPVWRLCGEANLDSSRTRRPLSCPP